MAALTSAIVGIGTGIAGAAMSFSQAAKAKSNAAEATKASKELMIEAEKKAEVEYMQKLNIPLDSYDEEYKQNLANTQQNVAALQEGDARNLAAGVGKVGAAGVETNEAIRITQGKDEFELQKMQLEEQSAINQDLKDMKVGASADQQIIARDAKQARVAAISSGVSAVGTAIGSAAQVVPLYTASRADKQANKIADMLDPSKLMETKVNKDALGNESKYEAAKLAVAAGTGTAQEIEEQKKLMTLYQPTLSVPIGRERIIAGIKKRNYTKDQRKATDFLENFDYDFSR